MIVNEIPLFPSKSTPATIPEEKHVTPIESATPVESSVFIVPIA